MERESIRDLARGLERGEISSEELVRNCIAEVERADKRFNSFITVSAEHALAAAREADRHKGDRSALLGIPMAHKDIFCTDGGRTTAGSRMLSDFRPPYDATVVARLRAAGAICIGKTNMDEFAMGSSNETSFFGAVRNPWRLECVPGGSSGGSAAAVAAGLVPYATGTDTGGSIRQPAALTGVTGLKPTYGRVSRYGIIAFASSLDQAGTLTRSAEDAAYVLQAIAGFDAKDSTSVDEPVPNYLASLPESIEGLRIGIPREFFDDGLAPGVASQLRDAAKALEELGCHVEETSLPNLGLSVPTYYVIAPAEASSNLARYDGVRFGHRCQDPADVRDLYVRSRAEGFGTEVKRRILIGTYVLSHGYYDAYYLRAQRVRRQIAADFAHAFEKYDLLVGPTTPTPAFPLGAKTENPVMMYLNDIYTIGVNLAGLPAISVPMGLVDGLPVGMQIIGRAFDEPTLLRVAYHYQQATDWHLLRPKGSE